MSGVSCTAVAVQNSSQWPCSMCPFPSSDLWGWGDPIYIFLIFPGHLEFWTPLQILAWGPPSWLHPVTPLLLLPQHQKLFIFSWVILMLIHSIDIGCGSIWIFRDGEVIGPTLKELVVLWGNRHEKIYFHKIQCFIITVCTPWNKSEALLTTSELEKAF